MPVFNDSNNIPELLPAGDYVFCVVGFTAGFSTGPKTQGADKYELELELEPSGKTITENLIDHASCAWKIDTFLKSSGAKLAKGEPFEFIKSKAESAGVKWINPIGLRGWCHVVVEEYNKRDGTKGKGNKVSVFYVDKPKLEPRAIETEETPF